MLIDMRDFDLAYDALDEIEKKKVGFKETKWVLSDKAQEALDGLNMLQEFMDELEKSHHKDEN